MWVNYKLSCHVCITRQILLHIIVVDIPYMNYGHDIVIHEWLLHRVSNNLETTKNDDLRHQIWPAVDRLLHPNQELTKRQSLVKTIETRTLPHQNVYLEPQYQGGHDNPHTIGNFSRVQKLINVYFVCSSKKRSLHIYRGWKCFKWPT